MSNTLYVCSGSKLKSSNQEIIVQINDETIKIPINSLNCIIIENQQCSITAGVNVLCASNSIPIIYCNNKYEPICISNSFNTYYKQYFKLSEQIKWRENRKIKLFVTMIKQKIHNQIELLKYFNKDINIIIEIESKLQQINTENFENIEAVTARLYFQALFGNEFKRFAEDEINISLNYGYAILRAVIKQEIVAKGLIPPLGLWHKSQFNNYNLADDIIEVYRPMVDYITYLFIIKDDNFTKEERIYLQNVIYQKVIYYEEIYEYKTSLDMYINQIIKYMNKEINKIKCPELNSELYEY